MQISASARSSCDRQVSIKPCSAPHFHWKCGALFCREEPSQLPGGRQPSQSAPDGRSQIPLFVTYGDIFPRSGGSLSSQGELFAIFRSARIKLPLRGSWRAVARLRGFVLRQASSPSPSLLRKSTSPKGRGSGETTNSALEPETIPLCQGLSPWESWQARQGLTERARMLPAIFNPFFHKHFGRCGKTARRVYLFAQKRGKINCKIRKCALRQVCRAGRTSTAHP